MVKIDLEGLVKTALRDFFFTYRTEKLVRIEMPVVGIFHRALHALVLFFILWSVIRNGTYMQGVAVTGHVSPFATSTTTPVSTARGYCSNAAYDYVYDADFNYQVCTGMCILPTIPCPSPF